MLKYINKWLPTCLLDGVNNYDEKCKLAMNLENCVNYIFRNDHLSDFVKTVLLPTTARIFYKIKDNVDIENLVIKLNKEDSDKKYSNKNYYTCLDLEMEKVINASNSYITSYENGEF